MLARINCTKKKKHLIWVKDLIRSYFLRAMKKSRFQLGAPLREREVPLEIMDKMLTILLSLFDQSFSAFARPENEAIYNQSFRRYVQKTDTY